MTKESVIRPLDDPATTTAELAEALGWIKRKVTRLSKRDNWPYLEVPHPGNPLYLYTLNSIPDEISIRVLFLRIERHNPAHSEIQAAVQILSGEAKKRVLHQAAAEIAIKPLAKPPAPIENRLVSELNDKQRIRMEARNAVLAVIDEMALSIGRGKAIMEFIRMANQGELPEGTMTLLLAGKNRSRGKCIINRATIYNWFDRRLKGQVSVAPKKRMKAGHPAWLPQLMQLYQVPQKPTIAACIRDWEKYYPESQAPHIRAAQRHIEELPAEIRHYGRMGRRSIRAIQPFVRRTFDGLWPMDVVTVDGHLFKAYVSHPATGRRFRPELTTYLDIATRKAVGFSAWLAESQYAIWIALREMVTEPSHGVPALHYSDNGAYRGDQHRGTLSRVGTTMMFSEAYRAQARGVIERFNSSVWVPLAKSLPTYAGRDTDQEHFKKALRKADADGSGIPGWQDFIAGCRQALSEYNDRPHRSLCGDTPNQAWSRAVTEGWQPTLLDADDLHDLLPSVERKVLRGEVSLPWGRYFDEALSLWHGRTVRVGYNPTAGAEVWVSEPTGQLICTAQRDGNARPYVPESMLDHARALREKGRVDRLERKIGAAREEGAMQIEAQPIDPGLMELAQANMARIQAEFDAAPAFTVPEGDPERYQLWKRLDASKDPLTPDESAFYDRFRTASFCQTMLRLEEEFDQATGKR